jgi:hypothetical protein
MAKNAVNSVPVVGGIAQWAGYASGTPNAPGGLATLAENGMELVASPGLYNVPKGSRVYSNSETMDILNNVQKGGGVTINVYPAQSVLTLDGLTEIQRRVGVLYG